MSSIIEARAAAYIKKLPPAISGRNGHNATFAAACRLVEFGLTEERAALLLAGWNETHCQPRWTDAELKHKLSQAFKRTSPNPDLIARRAVLPFTKDSRHFRSVRIAQGKSKCPITQTSASAFPKSELVTISPRFQPGTSQDFHDLAKARGLSEAGIALASNRGLLRFCHYHGAPAWVVLDSTLRNGCARRMDGGLWSTGDAKSLVFRGACAQWPVGIEEAKHFGKILLCEGAPDLLAAFHFIAEQGREADCAAVAMLSGTYSLPTETLERFSGKSVHIFAHDDDVGYRAAVRWQAALEPFVWKVEIFCFKGVRTRDGKSVRDLNSFAQCADTAENRQLTAKLLP